jgi:glucose-6-phosphate 1-epimerase
MMSAEAVMDGTKPIRGGIPVVFPQFGGGGVPGSPTGLPMHGFARVSQWSVASTEIDATGACVLTMRLTHADLSAEVQALWPHAFELLYTVRLGGADPDGALFRSRLTVANTGAAPFGFQALLHTYYSVSDATSISIDGLGGGTFVDKLALDKGEQVSPAGAALTLAAETDVIFVNQPAAAAVTIHPNDGTESITITRAAVVGGQAVDGDCVLWNPWVTKSKAMADFGADEWQRMVCVEPGLGLWDKAATLAPGASAFVEQGIVLGAAEGSRL